MTTETLTYGAHPAQHGTLHRPSGRSRGVVVVIHGGFWKAEYDASLGEPLARDLAARGWTAWNLEYRRVGAGGGWPQTFDDVAEGIDRLVEVEDLDLTSVVTLGHSAGGHLAAGAATAEDLGSGAVRGLLGRAPDPDPVLVDPTRQLPLDVPLWCVHGTGDTVVPLSQSADYVAAASAAGARAELVEVNGDHFTVIDVTSEAWARTVEILDGP